MTLVRAFLVAGAVLVLWVALLGHSLEAVVFGCIGIFVAYKDLRRGRSEAAAKVAERGRDGD